MYLNRLGHCALTQSYCIRLSHTALAVGQLPIDTHEFRSNGCSDEPFEFIDADTHVAELLLTIGLNR